MLWGWKGISADCARSDQSRPLFGQLRGVEAGVATSCGFLMPASATTPTERAQAGGERSKTGPTVPRGVM